MRLALLAPVALCILGAAGTGSVPRVLPPATATRLLLATLVVTTAGLLSALALTVSASASRLDAPGSWIGWCLAPVGRASTGFAVAWGATALVALVGAVTRGVRHGWRMHRHRRDLGRVEGVQVTPVGGPVAFAVPRRPGGIVVGVELLGALTPHERAAVLAHEQAHLDLGHHRYLALSGLLGALAPPLTPLVRRLHYSIERWADEVAAARIGSRRVVASALAKAALLGVPPPPAASVAGLTGCGVADRVHALLQPPTVHRRRAARTFGALSIGVAAFGAAVQAHHLVAFLHHACAG